MPLTGRRAGVRRALRRERAGRAVAGRAVRGGEGKGIGDAEGRLRSRTHRLRPDRRRLPRSGPRALPSPAPAGPASRCWPIASQKDFDRHRA